MKFNTILAAFVSLMLSTSAIAQADVGKVAKVGQATTLTVTANGTTPFTYQWSKEALTVAGATTNPLVIASSTLTTAGAYTVVVGNSAGSVTSNKAFVYILGAPTFSTQPAANTSVPIGGTFSLTVVANAVYASPAASTIPMGTPALSYQWYKNAVAIAGATIATFSVPVASAVDSATYTCIANTAWDGQTTSTTSAAAVVAVNVVPPTITGLSITVN